jgi:hypothetical protein
MRTGMTFYCVKNKSLLATVEAAVAIAERRINHQ